MTDFVFTTGDVGEMDSTSTANRFFFVTLSEVNYRNVFLHYTPSIIRTLTFLALQVLHPVVDFLCTLEMSQQEYEQEGITEHNSTVYYLCGTGFEWVYIVSIWHVYTL